MRLVCGSKGRTKDTRQRSWGGRWGCWLQGVAESGGQPGYWELGSFQVILMAARIEKGLTDHGSKFKLGSAKSLSLQSILSR